MYRTNTPPELERKPSYNTLEIGGKSAKFLTRSGSLGSRHRLLPSSQFSPSNNPFSERQMENVGGKLGIGISNPSGTGMALKVGTLVKIIHVAITLALLVLCTAMYRDRIIKTDFIDACEKDHVTTRHELELALSQLNRYKILQNTFNAAPVPIPPQKKCPECPTKRAAASTVPYKKQSLSTSQVDGSGSGGTAPAVALKRLIEERDGLEKKLKTAHLKSSPSVAKLIDSYRSSEQNMIGVIKEMSRELLVQKFGSSPYYVEFILGFSSAELEPQRVLVELAGNDLPYTTLYFMTQLSKDMWRGCHINLNLGHILQVDPGMAPRGTDRYSGSVGAMCDREKFNSILYADGAGRVVFQEYSESRPHVPFTFGLAGRVSGPSFYINTVDNSEVHGPGGQPTDDDVGSIGGSRSGSADPCFGRIVSGYDVIQRIQQQPLSGGANRLGQLDHFVTILDAVVVRYTKPAFMNNL